MGEPSGGEPAQQDFGLAAGSVVIAGLAVAVVGAVWWLADSGRTGPMLVLAGVGALLVGSLSTMSRGPALRLSASVGFGLLVVGLEALFFTSTRLIGALVGAVALALFLFSVGLYTRPGRALGRHPVADRGRVAGPVLLAAVCLAVPLGILGLGSLAVHRSGSFVRHYGTTTVVVLPDVCTSISRYFSWPRSPSNVECPGATWLDGRTEMTGTLEGRVAELSTPGPFRGFDRGYHVETIEAYVYGDKAYTAGASRDVGPVALLGHLHPSSAIALPAALVVWFAMRRLPWWRRR